MLRHNTLHGGQFKNNGDKKKIGSKFYQGSYGSIIIIAFRPTPITPSSLSLTIYNVEQRDATWNDARNGSQG